MKKYILIQNDGEIETNSFELIGASTKRGESGKIGFFGSGLKYSIAFMMRNNIEFKVYSGEKELSFTTQPEHLKDKTFDRICINSTPTSYTTTMGPTWTEEWFVLREIYCNALDEAGCTIVKETESINPSQGKTRIYIELTPALQQVISNWDNYFSDERQPLFECDKIYTSGLGSHDGSQEAYNYQSVRVLAKTKGSIFRRGIKVSENETMLYDYEFSFVDINEDRTAKSAGSIDYAISDMFGRFENESWLKSILRTGNDDKKSKEYSCLNWNTPDQGYSDKWVKFSNENMLVVKEISGRYAEEISMSKKEVFLLPSHFARDLKKKLPLVRITGMGTVVGDNCFDEVEKTPKMDYLLKEVITSLKQMNYEVPFDIAVAEFEDDAVLGKADIKEKKIFIAKKTFDMGRREIAMTLMEETEHIRSGAKDETRLFQTHIFSQWLKMIEDANGLFL